ERRRRVGQPLFVVRIHVWIPLRPTVSVGPAISCAGSRGIVHFEIVLAIGGSDCGGVQCAMLLEEKLRRLFVGQWPLGGCAPFLSFGSAYRPVMERLIAHHAVVNSFEPEVVPAQMFRSKVEAVGSAVKPGANDHLLRTVKIVEPESGFARKDVVPA